MRFAHKASIKSGISKTQLLKKLAKVEQSHMHFTGTGRERESQEPARSHHCSDGGGWGQIHLKGIPLRKQCFQNTHAHRATEEIAFSWLFWLHWPRPPLWIGPFAGREQRFWAAHVPALLSSEWGKNVTSCSDLKRKCPIKLRNLNTWSLVDGIIWQCYETLRRWHLAGGSKSPGRGGLAGSKLRGVIA